MKSTVQYNSASSIKKYFIPYQQTQTNPAKRKINYHCILYNYTTDTKMLRVSVDIFAISPNLAGFYSLLVQQEPSSFKSLSMNFPRNVLEAIQFFKVSVGCRQYWTCRFAVLCSCQVIISFRNRRYRCVKSLVEMQRYSYRHKRFEAICSPLLMSSLNRSHFFLYTCGRGR